MKMHTRLILHMILSIVCPFLLVVVAYLIIASNLSGSAIVRNVREGGFLFVADLENVASSSLVATMAVAFLIILVITNLFLTRSIYSSFFVPIRKLSAAMTQISEGNFECQLEAPKSFRASKRNKKSPGSELASLFENFEQMRLQLKESANEQDLIERKKIEFIGNISHDLRTPLTAVKGYVEGILDGVANTPEKVESYMRTITQKTNDMDRLINELALYSGIKSDRIYYQFQKIPIYEYFNDCADDVGTELKSKDIEFSYSNLIEKDTLVIADPEQLKRVIDNIISNSIKYLDKPCGEIRLEILDSMDSVTVEIEDNGCGILQKDLPYIFDRFYRTDKSRNSEKGGSGVGLSIVKKIIEEHGGYIWATSKEGEGTCIHFVLRKYFEVVRAARDSAPDKGEHYGKDFNH